jgi:iron-sulfur cluster assembly protein
MKFKDTPSNEDLNMKQDSLNLAVDKETSEMLEGLEIDYVDTLNDTGFKFNNPKAEHGCGCGKSFA